MKIFSDDGREFKSVDECNAYEANLKLKKEKEEAEKAEKLKKERQLYEQILIKVKELNDIVIGYEALTNKQTAFTLSTEGNLKFVNNKEIVEALRELTKTYIKCGLISR